MHVLRDKHGRLKSKTARKKVGAERLRSNGNIILIQEHKKLNKFEIALDHTKQLEL